LTKFAVILRDLGNEYDRKAIFGVSFDLGNEIAGIYRVAINDQSLESWAVRCEELILNNSRG